MHVKLHVAYDGADFVGWQRQSAGVSIQGLLEEALAALDGRPVAVAGAGRTDAGVHALAQVASFTLERELAPAAIVGALNARLPPAVRVFDAAIVPASFHARFDARRKTYRYRIWNGAILDPFERRTAWHVAAPLDVEAMSGAAGCLAGRHDFSAFRAAGSAAHSSERTVFASSVGLLPPDDARGGPPGRVVVYEISGDGFLRHMVRTIAGSLVEVGLRRQPPAWLRGVLASRDRSQAGPTAPADGLCLVAVAYDAAADDSLAAES